MDPLRLIADMDGAFLRREALGCGYSDKSIRLMLREGVWRRLRHGAYCFADTWAAATPEERHLMVAHAVVKMNPGPVVLSHVTALVALGIDVWGADLTKVHVTRLDAGAGRVRNDAIHHEGRLADADWTLLNSPGVVDGLGVTVPARAVIESTMMLSIEAGLVSADSALHDGVCTPDDLRETFAVLNHWPGSLRTHMVLQHMDGRHESVGETRSDYLFRIAGLPRPIPQYAVWDNGLLIGTADFGWPDQRLLGEFDGKIKYGRLLRPGETASEVVFREKQREDLLREVTGFGMGRVIWPDLDTPAHTARRFARLMNRTA